MCVTSGTICPALRFTGRCRPRGKEFGTYTYLNNLGPFYTSRYSSRHSSAWDAQLNFQCDYFTAGAAYRSIAPGYQSMGTLHLTSDVKDDMLNTLIILLNKRLSLSGSAGLQRDNFDRKQSTGNRCIIGSYTVSQSLNVSMSCSNFNSATEPSRVLIRDSIKYAQVSQNVSVSCSYSMGGEDLTHLFSLVCARQTVNTINTGFTAIERTGTGMNNATADYRLNSKPADAGVSVSFNATRYVMNSVVNMNYGPQLSVSKGFLDRKLKTGLSYSLQCSDSQTLNGIYAHVFRLTEGYSYNRHHSLSFNANLMMRSSQPAGKERTKARELIGTLSYHYSF